VYIKYLLQLVLPIRAARTKGWRLVPLGIRAETGLGLPSGDETHHLISSFHPFTLPSIHKSQMLLILLALASLTAAQRCTTGYTEGLANYQTNGITNPPSSVKPLSFTVVRQLPRNTSMYTQGLSVVERNGKKVFLSSTGRVGESGVGYTDMTTGRILEWVNTPGVFGEGTTMLGDDIYQLTWQSCKGNVFSSNLTLKGGWNYTMEGWGITECRTCKAEERLVMTDGTDRLFYLNPKNMTQPTKIAKVFEFGKASLGTTDAKPVSGLNEIEFIETNIWANVYTTSYVIVTTPAGIVKHWIDFTGLLEKTEYLSGERRVPGEFFNGIAWDAQEARLYVTGKLWPRVFEVAVWKDDAIWAGDGVRPTDAQLSTVTQTIASPRVSSSSSSIATRVVAKTTLTSHGVRVVFGLACLLILL